MSSSRDASTTRVLRRYYQKYQQKSDEQPMTPLPFELEVVESALMVSTGGWRVYCGVGCARYIWGSDMHRIILLG